MLSRLLFHAGIAITAVGVLVWLGSYWGFSCRGVTAGYEWSVAFWLGELVFTDSPINLNPAVAAGRPSMDAGTSLDWWLLRGRVGVTNINGASCLSWIRLPLWIIPVAGALLAASSPAAWKRRNRRGAGHCRCCGYDRCGLKASAPCPECGACNGAAREAEVA